MLKRQWPHPRLSLAAGPTRLIAPKDTNTNLATGPRPEHCRVLVLRGVGCPSERNLVVPVGPIQLIVVQWLPSPGVNTGGIVLPIT